MKRRKREEDERKGGVKCKTLEIKERRIKKHERGRLHGGDVVWRKTAAIGSEDEGKMSRK